MEQIVATPVYRKLLTNTYFQCLWPNSSHLPAAEARNKVEDLRNLIAFIRGAVTKEEKMYFGLSIPELEEAIRRMETHLAAGGGNVQRQLEVKAGAYEKIGKLFDRRELRSLRARGFRVGINLK